MAKKNKGKKNKEKKAKAEKKKPSIELFDVSHCNDYFGPPRSFREKHAEGHLESWIESKQEKEKCYIKIHIKIQNTGLDISRISQCLDGYEIFHVSQISKEKAEEDTITVSFWTTQEEQSAALNVIEMALL